MKKKIAIISLLAGTVAMLTACGSSINPDKYVTQLAPYEGVQIEMETPVVTDEDVDERIALVLSAKAETIAVEDRAVQGEDTVNIDFVGYLNGEPFEGGDSQGQGYDLTIGSGQFIPGFEEGLIGKSIGEEVRLQATFPENYDSETLKGQTVEFVVQIHSISAKVMPELTDEYVPTLSAECSTVAEYREYIYNQILDALITSNASNKQYLTFDAIYKASTVGAPPQDIVDRYINMTMANLQEYLNLVQTDYESYLTSQNTTAEEFEADVAAQSYDIAQRELVARAIAKAAGIKVTDKDIKQFAQENYEKNGYSKPSEYIEAQGGKETLRFNLLVEKVFAYIAEYAVVVEPGTLSTGETTTDETAETAADETTETTADETAAE